jgi:hypothetical protein
MDARKPIGKIFSGRLFAVFCGIVFLFFLPFYLTRELWFDEVLTLQFAALPSVAEIYHSYFIPNNQIIHTCFIHGMLEMDIDPVMMRIFPLLCGILMIYLLWKNFSREVGKPLIFALGALVLSPPFLLYATALRGYMAAALFAVCALIYARKFALGGKYSKLFFWGIFSLLCVGVMPSALAAVAAAGLYAVPYCGKKFWKNKRLYLLGIVPFVSFFCFYFPIRGDLLKAFELKEGWHQGEYALLAVLLTVVITFFIPLIAGIFFHRRKWQHFPRTLIWFLPLAGLLLPVSPFPRVWFVLLPFFALLCGGFLRKLPPKWWKFVAAAVVLWGGVTLTESCRTALSPAVSLAGQDDFYAPRFATAAFTPSDTAKFLQKFRNPVFVSFAADPYAAAYYRRDIIMDVPPGRRKEVPAGTVLVLAAGEDPAAMEERFGVMLREIYRNQIHVIYEIRGK